MSKKNFIFFLKIIFLKNKFLKKIVKNFFWKYNFWRRKKIWKKKIRKKCRPKGGTFSSEVKNVTGSRAIIGSLWPLSLRLIVRHYRKSPWEIHWLNAKRWSLAGAHWLSWRTGGCPPVQEESTSRGPTLEWSTHRMCGLLLHDKPFLPVADLQPECWSGFSPWSPGCYVTQLRATNGNLQTATRRLC